MPQFKAAWDRFADDEANLVEFMNAKRKGARDAVTQQTNTFFSRLEQRLLLHER